MTACACNFLLPWVALCTVNVAADTLLDTPRCSHQPLAAAVHMAEPCKPDRQLVPLVQLSMLLTRRVPVLRRLRCASQPGHHCVRVQHPPL